MNDYYRILKIQKEMCSIFFWIIMLIVIERKVAEIRGLIVFLDRMWEMKRQLQCDNLTTAKMP
jgi:hypothetical protein